MPCYQVRTTTVKIEAVSKAILSEAMMALGYADAYTYDAQRQELRIEGRRQLNADEINAVKREISKSAVKAAAKRFGWKIQETADGQYTVQKAGL